MVTLGLFGLYWDYIGIILGLYWDYISININVVVVLAGML